MIAKFKTKDGWLYFDKVSQANLLNGETINRRREMYFEKPDYELCSESPREQRKMVDILIPDEDWVTVEYSLEAYLCTDRGETINAI